jgi:hypothetical protein
VRRTLNAFLLSTLMIGTSAAGAGIAAESDPGLVLRVPARAEANTSVGA